MEFRPCFRADFPLKTRTVTPDHCPADPQEAAVAYLLGELRTDGARVFEEHYITCPRCAGILEETDQYVLAMKQATQRLRRSKK